MANPLAACLAFDQLSCKVENIWGAQRPHAPHQHIPARENCTGATSLPEQSMLRINCVYTATVQEVNRYGTRVVTLFLAGTESVPVGGAESVTEQCRR